MLAEALEKYRDPEGVRPILLEVKEPAKVDVLWKLWAKDRLGSLGDLLRNKRQPADDEGLRLLSRRKAEKMKEAFGKPVETIRKVLGM